MAKVKIQGNASGTGVLTVTAPNTSTDRTITLPDSTGTLATTADVPSSITDNGDATAITIDSSERVGIGTGSPLTNSLLHIQSNASSGVSAINNGLLLVENNTGVGIGLLSNNDRQQTIAFGDPEDNDVGFINYGHDTNQMSFNVNAAERMRITANGVTFNGDTAAANALDDYEEGTWTPAYTPQGGSFGISYVGAIPGRYVKIGKQVTCWFYIGTDGVNTSAATGDNVYLTGLPFAAENVSAGVWGTAVYSEKWSGENPTHAVISSTESRLQLFYRSTVNGSSNNRSKYVDMGTGGDSNYVRGFITYTV